MTTSSVQAELRYLVPCAEKPIYIASRGGADAQLSINAKFEDRRVTIQDARQLERPASLDRQGFTLLPHNTSVDDFYALEGAQSDYEAELRELVLQATSGSEVLVFDHTLRSYSSAIRGVRETREPAVGRRISPGGMSSPKTRGLTSDFG